MLVVNINVGIAPRAIHTFNRSATALEVIEKVTQLTGLAPGEFYIVHNGRLARNEDICENGRVDIVPRILGGKGGFGSMLRAIGAQIEKTTNREACRDLSGRRLRDINEEKRLKSWIDKQATREEEAVERKKKKLERLCAQPKHEFKDKNYEKERSTLTEKVGDAVEEGFKLAMAASSSGEKRKAQEDKRNTGRKRLALDLDIDSDELGTSDDESDSDSRHLDQAESGSSSRSSQDSDEIKSANSEAPDSGGSCEIQPSQNSDTNDSNPSTKSLTNEDDSNSNSLVVKKGVEKAAVAL